ncbi:PAS domain S-box protein [Sorangium sp. So ce1153]|uniref:PAS domain S-box protein n=1 Tax=Sorangium sp. So ce1153 TaxID=3133333 RepID=UPI003F60C3CA
MSEGGPTDDPRIAELFSILVQASPEPGAGALAEPDGAGWGRASQAVRALVDEVVARRATQAQMERRLDEIMVMLNALVSFDFTVRAEIGDKGDSWDALAMGLNMVAEELASRVVSREYVDNIIESMSDLLIVVDRAGLITSVNAAAYRLSERTSEELLGQPASLLFPAVLPLEMSGATNLLIEETAFLKKSGDIVAVSLSASVMINGLGEIQGFVCVARDLSERKRLEEEERQRLQQVVETQALLLEELSTPLMPIADQILAMPVIGSVDDRRSTQILETLLNGVVAREARIVIIDITGVRKIDARAVQGIVNAVKAVRLLGAQVILTGIRPEVAVALMALDLNLGGVLTFGSLQTGIAHAMRQLRQVKPENVKPG